MNSRTKGAVGEREWRDQLRNEGFTARRGQQFAGGPDSPDVICEELSNLHMEVKRVQNLNLDKACEQAERDSRHQQDQWCEALDKSGLEFAQTILA